MNSSKTYIVFANGLNTGIGTLPEIDEIQNYEKINIIVISDIYDTSLKSTVCMNIGRRYARCNNVKFTYINISSRAIELCNYRHTAYRIFKRIKNICTSYPNSNFILSTEFGSEEAIIIVESVLLYAVHISSNINIIIDNKPAEIECDRFNKVLDQYTEDELFHKIVNIPKEI